MRPTIDDDPTPRLGAYGIGVDVAGADRANLGLLDAPPNIAPVVTVERRRDPDVVVPEPVFDDQQLHRELLHGGRIDIDRSTRRAVVTTPFEIDDHDLVHPYLAPVGAVWARWAGREAFHCSAVVWHGRVWGILGEREAGKSTLVAWLATHDVPVMTDDLLVVDVIDGAPVAYAGPRSVDLRAPTAEQLVATGLAEEPALRQVRERGGPRHRLRLGDVSWQLPLGGWFILEEGPALEIEPVAVTERLRVLADHRTVRLELTDATQWMDLTSLPTHRVRRPKDWEQLADVVVVLERTAAATA